MPSPPLLIAAMTAEVGPLVRALRARLDPRWRSAILYRADPANILVTGVGSHRAHTAAQHALEHLHPRSVLICGLAGALDEQLRTGDVLRPTRLTDSTGAPLGDDSGPALHTADRLAASVQDKQSLRRSTGAAAVDMESAAVARCCQAAGVPWRCLRVISDDARTALPAQAAGWTRPDGRADLRAVAVHLLFHPWLLLRLIRLGLVTHHCANILCQQVMRDIRAI
jgi:adenosylhomocysteine nucleosidase